MSRVQIPSAAPKVRIFFGDQLPTAEIPDLSGMSRLDALAALAAVGLTGHPINGDNAWAIVTSQDPAAGSVVDVGTFVAFRMGVAVPDTIGLPFFDATDIVRSRGLTASARSYDQLNRDSVVEWQRPAPDVVVELGTVVDVATGGTAPDDALTSTPCGELNDLVVAADSARTQAPEVERKLDAIWSLFSKAPGLRRNKDNPSAPFYSRLTDRHWQGWESVNHIAGAIPGAVLALLDRQDLRSGLSHARHVAGQRDSATCREALDELDGWAAAIRLLAASTAAASVVAGYYDAVVRFALVETRIWGGGERTVGAMPAGLEIRDAAELQMEFAEKAVAASRLAGDLILSAEDWIRGGGASIRGGGPTGASELLVAADRLVGEAEVDGGRIESRGAHLDMRAAQVEGVRGVMATWRAVAKFAAEWALSGAVLALLSPIVLGPLVKSFERVARAYREGMEAMHAARIAQGARAARDAANAARAARAVRTAKDAAAEASQAGRAGAPRAGVPEPTPGHLPSEPTAPGEPARGPANARETRTVGPEDRPSAAERRSPATSRPPESAPPSPDSPGKPAPIRRNSAPEPASSPPPPPPIDTELEKVARIVEEAVAKGRPPASFTIDARNATNIAKVSRNPGDAAVRGRPLTKSKGIRSRTIALDPEQNAAADRVVKELEEHGFEVKRVNQTQVGEVGRMGRNRPDIQVYSEKTRRFFDVEIDAADSARGLSHAERILNNDPDAGVVLVQFLR